MTKLGFIFLVSLFAAQHIGARVLPGDSGGFTDQKNFVSFGGIGGYSGLGSSGIPFGGIGGGIGTLPASGAGIGSLGGGAIGGGACGGAIGGGAIGGGAVGGGVDGGAVGGGVGGRAGTGGLSYP